MPRMNAPLIEPRDWPFSHTSALIIDAFEGQRETAAAGRSLGA